jgi:hypothetical protein
MLAFQALAISPSLDENDAALAKASSRLRIIFSGLGKKTLQLQMPAATNAAMRMTRMNHPFIE